MDHDIVYKTQIAPIVRDAFHPVATVLICQSTLIRGGIGHILSGSPFILADEALEAETDLPVLCLIYGSHPSDRLAETITQLKTQWPSARVVLLTDDAEPQTMMQAFQIGLDGLCQTSMNREALIKAFELVMLGEAFMPSHLVLERLNTLSLPRQSRASEDAILVRPSEPAANGKPQKLSDREAQVLQYLTRGASNKLIARMLGLTEATVKVHIKGILRKINASNRTQAAMWAQQHLRPEAYAEPLHAAE